jgi:hypothetical protein
VQNKVKNGQNVPNCGLKWLIVWYLINKNRNVSPTPLFRSALSMLPSGPTIPPSGQRPSGGIVFPSGCIFQSYNVAKKLLHKQELVIFLSHTPLELVIFLSHTLQYYVPFLFLWINSEKDLQKLFKKID